MKRITVHILQRLFGVYATLVFVLAVPPTAILLLLAPGLNQRRRIARRASQWFLFFCAMKPKTRGLPRLPDEGCVVVANHASYLDGIILTAVLPASFSFVIKREVTSVPIMHFVLRRIGSEFLARKERTANVRDSRRLLKKAQTRSSMVFFPEGTFQREQGLLPFRNGAFAAATRGGMPICPVVIRGARIALPSGALLPRWTRLTVDIHEPLSESGKGLAAQRRLMRETRRTMTEKLGEPDLDVGAKPLDLAG